MVLKKEFVLKARKEIGIHRNVRHMLQSASRLLYLEIKREAITKINRKGKKKTKGEPDKHWEKNLVDHLMEHVCNRKEDESGRLRPRYVDRSDPHHKVEIEIHSLLEVKGNKYLVHHKDPNMRDDWVDRMDLIDCHQHMADYAPGAHKPAPPRSY